MNEELLYQIALTMIPGIGDVHAKALLNCFHNPKEIFNAPKRLLEKVEGIGSVKAKGIKTFIDFSKCENEIKFIEKYKIKPLFFKDPEYPKRLSHCFDSPIMLYYKGIADLNNTKIISVIGTRKNSAYGKEVCEQFIKSFNKDILIVSGLAYGIDTIAHKAALKNNLSTVGVVAHGLNRIYPYENKTLATQMLTNGGLLTDFCSFTKPDRENFPKRNRIIAGMCDAILVIESGYKGGSMITAEIANSYNKDVFSVPGKINDEKSEGSNYLIRKNMANLTTSAEQIIDFMNWGEKGKQKKSSQKELFVNLTEDEQILASLIKNEAVNIDTLMGTGLSAGSIASALLNMEMQGLINILPGKRYSWVG
ncbi:MAG: DNA-processing protein DprA [Ferruginibacter sp.]